MKAEEVLKYMADLLTSYLEELKEYGGAKYREFCYGEQTAYTECLEIIQRWEKACQIGLDFDVEKKFPL